MVTKTIDRVLLALLASAALDLAVLAATTLSAGVSTDTWNRSYRAVVAEIVALTPVDGQAWRLKGVMRVSRTISGDMRPDESYEFSCMWGPQGSVRTRPAVGALYVLIVSPKKNEELEPLPSTHGLVTPTSTYFTFMPQGAPIWPLADAPELPAIVARIVEVGTMATPRDKVAALEKEIDGGVLPLSAALSALREAMDPNQPSVGNLVLPIARRVRDDKNRPHAARGQADGVMCAADTAYTYSDDRLRFLDELSRLPDLTDADRRRLAEEQARVPTAKARHEAWLAEEAARKTKEREREVEEQRKQAQPNR